MESSEIIDKASNHRENFSFHNNKRTDYGVIGEIFASRMRELLDKG